MIKNERQYKITRGQAERFRSALQECGSPNKAETWLERANRDALASQLADLEGQVKEYERLKNGEVRVFDVKDLGELPLALIRARIARGMTQAELAERLGLHMQQIQQYEANDYSNASFTRIKEVADSLDIALESDVFVPSDLSGRELLRKLQDIGLDRRFIDKRLVPIGAGRLEDLDSTKDLLRSARFASKALDIPISELLTESNPQPRLASLGSVRHKLPKGANSKKVSFYTVYAHYLGLLSLEATSKVLTRQRTPENTDDLHDSIVREYGELSFSAALRYVWDHLGIPVLPLRLHGGFHGATWRVHGRDVIVLNPGQSFPAFWLNDLLHEVGHTGQDPDDLERAVVEFDPAWNSSDESDDEVDARFYAIDTIFRSQAETLAQTVESSAGSIEGLKRAVEAVSARQGLPVDSFAIYMAAQYKETSWWPTAIKLQNRSINAFEVCRDEFFARADLSILSPEDREMLLLGLQGDEE